MLKQNNAKGVLPTDLKYVNRRTILGIYRDGNPHTPRDISETIGLSRLTVSKATDFFVEKGILTVSGKGDSTKIGGRKPMLYELNRRLAFAVINIDIDFIHFTLFNLYRDVLAEEKLPVNKFPSFDEVEDVVRCGAEALQGGLAEPVFIFGISITIRGLVDMDRSTLRKSPFYPDWKANTSFESFLRFFPDAELLVLDKPSRTFARYILNNGELEPDCGRAMVLFFDRGMGGALIHQGHIECGKNSIIGEMHYMVVGRENGKDVHSGSLITPGAALRHIRSAFPDSPLLKLTSPSFGDIFRSSSRGEPDGIAASTFLAEEMATLLSNINLSFDAEQIFLCGDFAEADENFMSTVKNHLRASWFYPEGYAPEITLEKAPLETMLTCGGAIHMLDRFFERLASLQDD
ncbi:MAG: ROK family protein [Lachnospiraceae bacterium]|nr:ROK family protein [Lachnospiraceae bacterium]